METKNNYAKGLKNMMDKHNASMAKGFKPVTPENGGIMEVEGPSEGPTLYFPTFRVKLKDIPEAKSWEVGKRYNVEVVVEQTSITNRKGSEPMVEFSVLGIKPGKPSKDNGKA